jgi:predicted hydrocarbon binding protein
MAVKIRGSILLARKTFVVGNFGEEAWTRVVNTLPPEYRQTLMGLMIHVGWYPFEISRELDRAIVDILGNGDPSVFESIGAQSARENLNHAQQAFLKPGNPEAFLQQAEMIYKFYYDVGRRDYTPVSQNSGLLTTYDAETFSAVDCMTVIGWYKEALKLCGAKSVDIVEIQCRAKGDKVCQYKVTWEE